MDKFLDSGYGEKSLSSNATAMFKQQLSRTNKSNMSATGDQQNAGQQNNMNSGMATGHATFQPKQMDEHDINMETSIMQHRTAHSSLPSYVTNSQAIKPSVSFMNLARDQQKLNHFVDLYDGPSTLQSRFNVKTQKDKSPESQSIYEKERDSHLDKRNNSLSFLNDARTALYGGDGEEAGSHARKASLRQPKEARDEIVKIKD